jgi:hypothetical protein
VSTVARPAGGCPSNQTDARGVPQLVAGVLSFTKRPTSLDRNAEPLYSVLEVEPL